MGMRVRDVVHLHGGIRDSHAVRRARARTAAVVDTNGDLSMSSVIVRMVRSMSVPTVRMRGVV